MELDTIVISKNYGSQLSFLLTLDLFVKLRNNYAWLKLF